jgi:hypothetical protein
MPLLTNSLNKIKSRSFANTLLKALVAMVKNVNIYIPKVFIQAISTPTLKSKPTLRRMMKNAKYVWSKSLQMESSLACWMVVIIYSA